MIYAAGSFIHSTKRITIWPMRILERSSDPEATVLIPYHYADEDEIMLYICPVLFDTDEELNESKTKSIIVLHPKYQLGVIIDMNDAIELL